MPGFELAPRFLTVVAHLQRLEDTRPYGGHHLAPRARLVPARRDRLDETPPIVVIIMVCASEMFSLKNYSRICNERYNPHPRNGA